MAEAKESKEIIDINDVINHKDEEKALELLNLPSEELFKKYFTNVTVLLNFIIAFVPEKNRKNIENIYKELFKLQDEVQNQKKLTEEQIAKYRDYEQLLFEHNNIYEPNIYKHVLKLLDNLSSEQILEFFMSVHGLIKFKEDLPVLIDQAEKLIFKLSPEQAVKFFKNVEDLVTFKEKFPHLENEVKQLLTLPPKQISDFCENLDGLNFLHNHFPKLAEKFASELLKLLPEQLADFLKTSDNLNKFKQRFGIGQRVEVEVQYALNNPTQAVADSPRQAVVHGPG